jgi:predicted nuclease of predicted toxin-antitoxin system
MRFLADMGVAMRVVEWLREQRHDATHLRDENLQRMPDSDIFRKAATEGRILLTFDLDFGEIVALSAQKNVTVVLFRLHNTRTPHVIERLNVALQEMRQILPSGAIVVIEEKGRPANRSSAKAVHCRFAAICVFLAYVSRRDKS